MTDSAPNNPVLTFEGKRYDLNTLPDELKELVRGMQVADAQLRMHEDTLNGLMALPNLIAVLLLSGSVFKLTRNYQFTPHQSETD